MPAKTGGTHSGNGNAVFVGLRFGFVSRGGPMTGGTVPAMQGSTRILTYPGAGNVQHAHTADVLVPVPAAGSTAKGVQLRVLRNGQRVAFGVPWDHGTRQDGIDTIRLEAQYIRTDGVLQTGALRGEARLTADYP